MPPITDVVSRMLTDVPERGTRNIPPDHLPNRSCAISGHLCWVDAGRQASLPVSHSSSQSYLNTALTIRTHERSPPILLLPNLGRRNLLHNGNPSVPMDMDLQGISGEVGIPAIHHITFLHPRHVPFFLHRRALRACVLAGSARLLFPQNSHLVVRRRLGPLELSQGAPQSSTR